MEETKYTLTILLKNEAGSARVQYKGVSREELLKDEKIAKLVRLHDYFIPKDEPQEGTKP